MAAPGIAPRILCIGIPVRDLTFRVESVPARGSKANASHLAEICGGNALNASIAIARLGGHVFFAGPMGDARETSSGFILDQMAQEGIDTTHIVRMPDMTTPVSAIMIDPSGERTLTIYRDPGLWRVKLPNADELLADCRAVLVESRCASFCVDLCAEARRRGIPVIVGVDRAMSLQDGLLTAASHLLFASEQVQETAGIADDAKALQRLARLTPAFLAATRGPLGTIWLNEAGEPEETAAFPVQAVDTLGAGDVFHGAFALGLAEGKGVPEALRFAAAAAALKCTRHGGGMAAPQRIEVEGFLRGRP
ncbi:MULTISPECIES: sugar kinase [Bradyrhizobium]|uniref:Sulfofructose kinase n=1 Tax=Bradyrhizobium ottawaense TaxID=931866 RepID=A0ABV4FRP9_9BRAD|nr:MULTISPECIES: sugar kinase [Bradyrhizobium]MBR1292754.1 sugar kinase [Bradyrhizobium ottawaense]MDA9416558.1 sugar kinase [Bradyrhizobium sp. CCBAU 25360]MDA9487274.1 sugar kinase [Bradyrhizobium sp. CCBAU 11445]PDT67222.1 sugar kinase [Bradyrhizobium ottawaense]WLB46813.1 sugar kinase [Bradyrhizobium ottawaense]